jgi:hypothetical protein
VSEAWFGFLGVIVGAVVAGAVSLLGEQFTTRREREARQAAREQELMDRRNAFQREAILALQDAIDSFWELTTRALNQAFAVQSETDNWPVVDAGTLPVDFNLVNGRVEKHRARVFDDELRSQAGYIVEEATNAIIAVNLDQALHHSKLAAEWTTRTHRRVNAVLKDLP